MIAIWDGGLAIYGAVIMAFIVLQISSYSLPDQQAHDAQVRKSAKGNILPPAENLQDYYLRGPDSGSAVLLQAGEKVWHYRR